MAEYNEQYQGGTDAVFDLEEPSQFRVLLHNDDYTPMDFVVHILQTVFHKQTEEAARIMLNVHEKGIGVCGMYPFQVAETKVLRVEGEARESGYPLRCTMEEV